MTKHRYMKPGDSCGATLYLISGSDNPDSFGMYAIVDKCSLEPSVRVESWNADPEAVAHRDRIIAAVNACTGMPSRMLSDGCVAEMLTELGDELEFICDWLGEEWEHLAEVVHARGVVAKWRKR